MAGRGLAIAIALCAACGGSSDSPGTDAAFGIDAGVDVPASFDSAQDVPFQMDAGGARDAALDAPRADRGEDVAADVPGDAVSSERPASVGDERDDARCGPENGEARCGPTRCCSRYGWCGYPDEPHCNESRGFDGRYDGPR